MKKDFYENMLKLNKMKRKILFSKEEQRLTMSKNWNIWRKAFGIWKNKKGPEPVKWQKKIREDRRLN